MESTTTTTTTAHSSGIGFRKEYLSTVPAWLKMGEMLFSLLTFICSASQLWFSRHGGGFVDFVAISAFVSVTIIFVLCLFGLRSRLPPFAAVFELIFFTIWTLFFLIAAIVCAVYAKYDRAIAAATAFAFISTAIFAVDTFIQFYAWRLGQTEMTTATHGTHTSTSHTTVTVTKEAY